MNISRGTRSYRSAWEFIMSGITIHQISDFIWFSERKTSGKYGNVISALNSHIKYIENKATAVFNSATKILAKAKEELQRRWDSRVALKFFIAVPKDWSEKEALDIAVNFVAQQLNIPLKNILACYHEHPRNPHIHFVVYPRDAKGRKLRINRKELKEFHKAWDQLLNELGYEIKRYKDGFKLENLRVKKKAFVLETLPVFLFERDEELKTLYEEYIKLREEIAQELYMLDENEKQAMDIRDEEIKKAHLKEALQFWKRDDFRDTQKEEIKAQIEALQFSPEDKVAIVLVGEGKKPLQRILRVKNLLSDKFLAFLRAKNKEGYNIYITINKLKPEARKRTKSDFEENQRAIYLDIDGDKLNKDGLEILGKIISENNLPKPTLVLKTSAKNCQAVWVLNEERKAQQLEAIMKNVAERYGLDYTQDIARVFRLAGFFNRKKGKGNFVYIDRKRSSFKAVDFEPFMKFLPTLTRLKKKQEQEKEEFELNVDYFKYSASLDRYFRAIYIVFSGDKYRDEIIRSFTKLAEKIKKGEKKFKSASEFELSLAHLINKALRGINEEERRKILAEKFKQILEIVRPEKLKRNKKYVELTISKVLRTPSRSEASATRVKKEIKAKKFSSQPKPKLGSSQNKDEELSSNLPPELEPKRKISAIDLDSYELVEQEIPEEIYELFFSKKEKIKPEIKIVEPKDERKDKRNSKRRFRP